MTIEITTLMKIISSYCQVGRFTVREDPELGPDPTRSSFDNVWLIIETDGGLTGRGLAAPDRAVTGEDVNSVMEAFRTHIEPALHGANPFFYSRIYEHLRDIIPGESSALAMVEIALYDLISQQAGVPLYMFLGGFRDKILTSVTIGDLPDEGVMKRARAFRKRGVASFKLKGGRDVERDIRIVDMLRKSLGPDVVLNLDTEQGYSLIEAAHFIRHTRHCDLGMLEQPTTPELTFQWHLLRQEGNVLIMADESLRRLSDSFSLTSRQVVDMLNIKLMKVGGITPALQINSSARSANVRCMMGCLDESSLGVAAALHVALARPNITHADLDSWLDLEHDPYAGMLRLEDGYLLPSDAPGLGWATR